MVWAGAGFGVAWSETEGALQRIRFARLDAGGRTQGPVQVLRECGGSARGPSVAWSGSEYAVAWWDNSSGVAEVHLARLDASGAPIGMPLQITAAGVSARWPALTWGAGPSTA